MRRSFPRIALCAFLPLLIALAAPTQAGTTKRCGGGGGNKTLTLSCSSGQMIIGVAGYGGTYVDDIGILCGRREGTAWVQVGDWKRGPKKVLPQGSGICNGGRAVVDISTNSAGYVAS